MTLPFENPEPAAKPEKQKKKRPPRKKPAPETAKQISQARRDANRKNAQLSTGPTSPDGKAISSRNSFKHGYCALVVPIPDEDPDVFDTRFHKWNAELNPAGEDHNAYAVAILVRHSQNLDRLAVARAARLAKLARDAVEERCQGRARGVAARVLRVMLEDPRPRGPTTSARLPEGREAADRRVGAA